MRSPRVRGPAQAVQEQVEAGGVLIAVVVAAPPPSGDGANLAMFDGAELAKAIAAHPGDVEAALTAYEEALFPRSAAFYADAHEILDLCLGERAPFGLIELFDGGPEGAAPDVRG